MNSVYVGSGLIIINCSKDHSITVSYEMKRNKFSWRKHVQHSKVTIANLTPLVTCLKCKFSSVVLLASVQHGVRVSPSGCRLDEYLRARMSCDLFFSLFSGYDATIQCPLWSTGLTLLSVWNKQKKLIVPWKLAISAKQKAAFTSWVELFELWPQAPSTIRGANLKTQQLSFYR